MPLELLLVGWVHQTMTCNDIRVHEQQTRESTTAGQLFDTESYPVGREKYDRDLILCCRVQNDHVDMGLCGCATLIDFEGNAW